MSNQRLDITCARSFKLDSLFFACQAAANLELPSIRAVSELSGRQDREDSLGSRNAAWTWSGLSNCIAAARPKALRPLRNKKERRLKVTRSDCRDDEFRSQTLQLEWLAPGVVNRAGESESILWLLIKRLSR